ncbi:IS66 family transposase, partial [Halorhodospira halophila]|uniref:IS66 family transposase n=1 Tax=Halorhodospira halophila TaxID=1053 RepID=UPI003D366DD5
MGSDSPSSASGGHPFEVAQVTISKREHIELRARANTYKRQHARARRRIQELERRNRELIAQHKAREAELLAKLEQAKAEVRGLRQRHFGGKSERAQTRETASRKETTSQNRRPRGQQPGSSGHGRTRLSELPAREEYLEAERSCPECGEPMVAMAGTRDTETVEIEVKAHRRVVKRQRYARGCQCGCLPEVWAPPPPPQLIPRGKFGISVWVEVLLSKYRYGQPTHRFCRDWRDHGVHLAQGTLTGGLRMLEPMFRPLMEAFCNRLRTSAHWHADETDWRVFEECEGKQGPRWYLWLFRTPEVVYFQLDPTRSAQVPNAVLTASAQGVLSVDRYAAYHKYVRENPQVQRALCWAHQRRDFLAVANQYPELWKWAGDWLERIALLYHRHAKRRSAAPGTAAYTEQDAKLRRQTERIRKRAEAERDDPRQHAAVRRLQRLMLQNWGALTVFLDHPQIDL